MWTLKKFLRNYLNTCINSFQTSHFAKQQQQPIKNRAAAGEAPFRRAPLRPPRPSRCGPAPPPWWPPPAQTPSSVPRTRWGLSRIWTARRCWAAWAWRRGPRLFVVWKTFVIGWSLNAVFCWEKSFKIQINLE